MHESNDMFLGKSRKVYFFSLLVGLRLGLAYSAELGEAEIAALVGKGVWSLSERGAGQSSFWHEKAGGYIHDPKLSLHEYFRGKQAIFLIVKQDRTISDVRLLPMGVMNYRVSGRDIFFVDVNRRYGLARHCKDKNRPSAIVIGLARPEKGRESCVHWTTKVRNAWEVNVGTGKLKDISGEGISCYLDGYPDSCE